MSRAQRRTWWIFGTCAAALALVMAWITAVVLRLENTEAALRAEADHQTVLRLAMWRMDTWLAPKLAREAGRPYFDYHAYYPQQMAFTKVLGEIAPGEVLTPSPLLTFNYDIFPLHFQYDALGNLTSPQVPTGNWLDLADANGQGGNVPACAALLETVRSVVQVAELAQKITGAEQEMASRGCFNPVQLPFPDNGLEVGANEYVTRSQVTNVAKIPDLGPQVAPRPDAVELGPLLPLWVNDPTGGAARLVFVRRVRVQDETLFQGVLADWPRLREALLAQAVDVLPPGSASLQRLDQPTGDDQEGRMLATVPALLSAPAPPPPAARWSTTRSVLVAAWLAMVLAIAAVGITLRSTVALGERRARFASAVTHELRTPLTTFRMYSEMLTNEMVQDPEQRATYLSTLRNEADRLSRLVENVLCFARLEEGRYRGRREHLGLRELIERVTPLMRQRTSDAEMELQVKVDDDNAGVEVDVDAVTQILFNLVDNACKYAAGADPAVVELAATASADAIVLTVCDHGPGIPAEHRAAVFRPFERGARAVGENATPGVGLGLALARALARDLGGDLLLDRESTDGARFELRVPRA